MRSLRLRVSSCAALVLIGSVLFACSGSDSSPTVESPEPTGPTPQNPGVVTATVGAHGGTIVNATGTGVEIPAGALPNNVQVSVSPTPQAPPPSGSTEVGTPTTFGPSGLQFAQPVTVVLAFDPSKLPANTDASRVVIFTAPDGTTNYTPLATKLRDATHVAAETTHFSVFVPAIPLATQPQDAGACVPVTCATLGNVCGPQPSGCGEVIDCGPCTDDDSGSGNDASATGNDAGAGGNDASAIDDAGAPASDASTGPTDAGAGGSDASVVIPDADVSDASVPDAGGPTDASAGDGGACVPFLCGDYGPGACGSLSNGCGQLLDCGTCPVSDAGEGGADAGQLPDGGQCMPLTCANYVTCGQFDDGCGAKLDCVQCADAAAPADASAGSDGGVCTPVINCPAQYCGAYPNGCGAYLDCTKDCGGEAGPLEGGGSSDVGPTDGSCMPAPCPPQLCGGFFNGCGDVQCVSGCDGAKPDVDVVEACVPTQCPPQLCGQFYDGCHGVFCSGGCDGSAGTSEGGACTAVACPLDLCGDFFDGCKAVFCNSGCDGGGAPPPPPPPPPPIDASAGG
jgi:hypothetical protein